ncbi:MAG: L,D-transpeptidase family protein [Bacteroidaceae bacterium]|nr:L,D-transpeptidase family protein [Bacteroidaceae bacterium]
MNMKPSCYFFVIIIVCLLTHACKAGVVQNVEEETPYFGQYLDSIDSTRLKEGFRKVLDASGKGGLSDKTVTKHYSAALPVDDLPLWFSHNGVDDDAFEMLAFLRREVPMAGLDTNVFLIPLIAEDLQLVQTLAFDSLRQDINDVLPRLDYNLSSAYMRFVTSFRYGFMRPDVVFNRLEYKPNTENKVFARLYDHSVEQPDYDYALSKMASSDRIKYLRESVPTDSEYCALRRAMQTAPDSLRKMLAINMERLRWRIIPKTDSLGQLISPDADTLGRRVIVNIPSQQLWAICPDSVLPMRICCGSRKNKTPMLSSMVSYMQVNPEWIVPQNIVKSDFLSHAGDSAYFAKNDYFITQRSTGDTLVAANVSAREMESGVVRIAQKRGAGNSLGRVIFRFASNYGIYLHDTNNRRAFNYVHRTLSHGCIRIEKPYEMACFMLRGASERTIDRMRISMDMEPLTDWGKKWVEDNIDVPRPIMLMNYQYINPHVPLRIVYFTAFPNPETGVVEYLDDVYGYDEVMLQEMKELLDSK